MFSCILEVIEDLPRVAVARRGWTMGRWLFDGFWCSLAFTSPSPGAEADSQEGGASGRRGEMISLQR